MSKNLLGEYIAELTDFTANGSFADLRENVKYYNEYNYAALVRTTDLDKYNFQPEVFTDKNGYEFLVKSRLFGGEIIVANVGSVGKVFKVPYYSLPMTLGPNAYLVRFDKDKIDQEYAYQFLISDFFKTELYRKIGSTTLQAINKDNFRSIELFVPNDINNQQRIAKILSTADAVIEKTQAAIAKYKAIKQGMLQDLFTRGIDINTNKLRPRYQDAPHLYKESKLGWIPREWEEKIVDDIAKVNGRVGWKGYTVADLRDFGPLALGATHIDKENKLDLSNPIHLSMEKYIESPEIMVQFGDLLIVQRGTIGKIVVIDRQIGEATINPSMVLLNNIKINNFFLYYQLCSFIGQLQIELLTTQTGVPMISQEQIKNINLIIPKNPKETDAIAERLKNIDAILDNEKSYLQKMQSLKKGLMEDLLCGKKQVKVAEEVLTQSEN